jgi:preprotein translocase subunit Sec61beta
MTRDRETKRAARALEGEMSGTGRLPPRGVLAAAVAVAIAIVLAVVIAAVAHHGAH